MKKIVLAMAALITISLSACSQSNKQKENKEMGKSIVVFFSHAGDNYAVGNIEVGNTKIVADYITELTGADQFEIVTHKYDGMAYRQHDDDHCPCLQWFPDYNRTDGLLLRTGRSRSWHQFGRLCVPAHSQPHLPLHCLCVYRNQRRDYSSDELIFSPILTNS